MNLLEFAKASSYNISQALQMPKDFFVFRRFCLWFIIRECFLGFFLTRFEF